MRRRLKRLISSLLVFMIVLGIVLPVFPEGTLKVNADNTLEDFYNPTGSEGKTMYSCTLRFHDYGLPCIYDNSPAIVDDFDFKPNENAQLAVCPSINKGESNAKFKSTVERVANQIPVKYKDDKSYILDFNSVKDTYMTQDKIEFNRVKDEFMFSSFDSAWGNINDDNTVLIGGDVIAMYRTGMYSVFLTASGYDTEKNIFYYFILELCDNTLFGVNSWDSITVSLVQSYYLLNAQYRYFEDSDIINYEYEDAVDMGYKYENLAEKVNLTDNDKAIIQNDIKNGGFTDLPTYRFIDSISDAYTNGKSIYISENNKNVFNDEGTDPLEIKGFSFGTKVNIKLNLDYKNGNYDGEEEKYKGFRSTIKPHEVTTPFSDMVNAYDIDVDGDGNADCMSVDITNNNFIDFGESANIVAGNCGDNENKQRIARQIADIIQAMCSVEMDNNAWADNANKYCYELMQKYPDSILILLPAFLSQMKESQKGYKIVDAITEMSLEELSKETDSLSYPTNAYEIMSNVIRYNFIQTTQRTMIDKDSEFTIGNGTKKVRMSFDENRKGDCDYTLKDIWDACTPEQKLLLSYTFETLYNLRFEVSYGNKWNDISYDYELSNFTYDKSVSQELITHEQFSIDSIKNVVSKRDESVTNTRSVYNVARNANSLGQYIIGINLYNEASGSADNSGIYSIYDATLHSMYHLNYEFSGINEEWYPITLPSSLGVLSEKVGDKYLVAALRANSNEDMSIFLQFIYNLTYAFEVAAFSEGAESKGYTADDIRAALLNKDSPAKAEFSWISETNNLAAWKSVDATNTARDLQLQGQDFSIGMIRSIIELHDFCEFLGVLDDSGYLKIKWTPAIEEYINLYVEFKDIFNAFRQNANIYSMADKGETTVEEPLGKFFSIEKKQLTDNWIKGFSVSSQFVPMETNLYDATSISAIEDSDWVSDFYYKYAFYRKALYINVNNSAIVDEFVSNTKSTTRVATLSDLLNYERDIALYIDDNFYNADDVNSVISKIDYTNVRQNTDATATENGGVITDLTNWASGAFNLAPQQILKTGPEMYYSNTLAQNSTKLNKTDTDNPNLLSKVIDAYLISNDEILGKNGKESVLDDYEYSVKQSYGVVSAVYKSETLYNETLKAIVSDNALFKSSKAICYTPGTSSSDWRSIYNYYMLANLEEQMKNDASSTLDLNAPIFCDIFGNIVTESGLVIIPAACNATLCGKYWTPYTVGWSEYYNNGNHIKDGELNDDVYSWLLGFDYESYVSGGVDADGNVVVTSTERNKDNGGGHFEIDRNGDLILRTTSINSGNLSAIVQWSTLSKNSTIIKQLFFNDAYFNKGMKMYSSRIVNLIIETLRGAPIESIDYEFEGIDGNQDISKYGVYMAYKLEEVTNSLISGTNGNDTGGNAVVTMPNLAFVEGIEYIVLYVFKIVFAVAIVGLAISLYMDAVINKLGLASVGKFIVTCLMVIFAITLVPNIITWSYYKANKDILKEEVGYVMMLNYCKTYDGSEIGITKVTTPETNTELFLKIDDISVDWWSIIDDVLFKDTFATVEELYDSQLEGNLMSELPDVQKKGDGLYINVQDIYDSTKLNYMPASGVIKNTVYGTGSKDSSVETVASFTLPYYVILEQLVANINEYNITRDITAYSYSVGNNGNIYTYDVIGPYLRSDEFLSEGYDILGLDRILRTGNNRVCYNFTFNENDIKAMELSQWYPTEAYTTDMRKLAVDNIYSYARQYVAKNASLIGKVPDEVYLKVMAMQIAIECNKEFLAPYGKSVEIMNIDTRDLARFMVSDRASMYKYYSYGYARYVYEQAGGLGVILAGFYIAILWITSFLKPLFMIIILGLLIVNAIFRKVLFRKENKAIEGYLIGCMCLCITNYTYAFMLKVSLNIANTSLGSITALACAFIVQIAYIVCLIKILQIEIKDWKNSGYGEFKNIGANVLAGVNHTKQVIVEKFMIKHNTAYGDTQNSRRKEYSINEPTVEDMMDRDAAREMNAADNPI